MTHPASLAPPPPMPQALLFGSMGSPRQEHCAPWSETWAGEGLDHMVSFWSCWNILIISVYRRCIKIWFLILFCSLSLGLDVVMLPSHNILDINALQFRSCRHLSRAEWAIKVCFPFKVHCYKGLDSILENHFHMLNSTICYPMLLQNSFAIEQYEICLGQEAMASLASRSAKDFSSSCRRQSLHDMYCRYTSPHKMSR